MPGASAGYMSPDVSHARVPLPAAMQQHQQHGYKHKRKDDARKES